MKSELTEVLVKTKELLAQLIKAIDIVLDTSKLVAPAVVEAEAVKEEPKKKVTLVEVRTALAGLSRDGYTNDVRSLLKKYGSDKLSGIKEEEYEALLSDAESLKKKEARNG